MILLVSQLALVIPLILTVLRTRSADGMSLTSEAIWLVAGVGWALYGHGIGSATLIASGSIAAIGSGLLTLLIWRHKPAGDRRSASLFAGLTAVGLYAPMAVAGVMALSVALAIFGVVQFLPQIRQTVIDVRAGLAFTGVSFIGTLMRSGYTLGWAIYAGAWMLWGLAVSQIDWPLVAWGLAGAVAFGLQAWAAARKPAPVPADSHVHPVGA